MENEKKDCLMFIEKLNKCNALDQDNCAGCSFYCKSTKEEKEKYAYDMKQLGTYLKGSK